MSLRFALLAAIAVAAFAGAAVIAISPLWAEQVYQAVGI